MAELETPWTNQSKLPPAGIVQGPGSLHVASVLATLQWSDLPCPSFRATSTAFPLPGAALSCTVRLRDTRSVLGESIETLVSVAVAVDTPCMAPKTWFALSAGTLRMSAVQ
jgi:hypothetical protein